MVMQMISARVFLFICLHARILTSSETQWFQTAD